jgi:uncharacterized protein YbbC (DUF1343 family)
LGEVLTGLDRLAREGFAAATGLAAPIGQGRVALLCNATTLTADGVPTADAIARVPGVRLTRILSPQHGFAAEKQDNMIASRDGRHPRLGVPITSLYGERRELAPEALDDIDVLVIDLQDVGTRVYTFLVTALLAMRTALGRDVPVVVLDRPNPIGGAIEGPVLEAGYHSFVGMIDVPLRHGLTPGEYCLYGAWRLGLLDEAEAARVASSAGTASAARGARGAGDTRGARGVSHARLAIAALRGWSRDRYYDETGLLWTMPSPNMPALETAIVYPGQVILEGTLLSEGRGTTRPFEICGAPFLDPDRVRAEIGRHVNAGVDADDGDDDGAVARGPLDGLMLREVAYEPTFHKYAGQCVRGFQLHVRDRARFHPVAFTTALLCAVRAMHPGDFAWREPPYEYEHQRLPVDLIYGTDRVRRMIDAGCAPPQITREWAGGLARYRERVAPFLLYGALPGGEA